MADLTTRPMTADEFNAFRARLISGFAAEHVEAGNWPADKAQAQAASQIDELLPGGLGTDGMLLLVAQAAGGEPVGHVWIALRRTDGGSGAWIFDIEVRAEYQGKGYGRALLAAAEEETVRHGVTSICLNVFGTNTVARRLYESSGYETTSLQMRKELGGAAWNRLRGRGSP